MASGSTDTEETDPLPQRFLDSVWLWAILALAFFTLSYVAWGLIDIFGTPAG